MTEEEELEELAEKGGWRAKLARRAKHLQHDTYALLLAYRDRRVPLYAKVWLALVIAYALSPIDLIPDFIPVIGYLDDLIIVPAGIYLALKMIPKPLMDECRARARAQPLKGRAKWLAIGAVVLVWVVVLFLVFWLVRKAVT